MCDVNNNVTFSYFHSGRLTDKYIELEFFWIYPFNGWCVSQKRLGIILYFLLLHFNDEIKTEIKLENQNKDICYQTVQCYWPWLIASIPRRLDRHDFFRGICFFNLTLSRNNQYNYYNRVMAFHSIIFYYFVYWRCHRVSQLLSNFTTDINSCF